MKKTSGNWFAGDLVSSRVAPLHNDKPNFASGDYETFEVTNNLQPESYQDADEKGRYFTCCKTAYRPYDLAVTAVLIATKHHFPKCLVKTDGEEKDWLDARILCNNLLGYGIDTKIGEE